MARNWRDSPAVRDLVRRLSESAADALRTSGGADGLDAQLSSGSEDVSQQLASMEGQVKSLVDAD